MPELIINLFYQTLSHAANTVMSLSLALSLELILFLCLELSVGLGTPGRLVAMRASLE